MAGELLIQVINIGRFRAIRPALDELDAGRALGSVSRAVLREVAVSPFADRRWAELLRRILNHPELELRVFLAPRELDGVIKGVVRVLCFENGAEASLTSPVGPSWVVLDVALAAFRDLDWFRAIYLDTYSQARPLAYPRVGFEGRYGVLSREEVARVAAGLRPLLDDPIATQMKARLKTLAKRFNLPVLPLSQEVRVTAEGLSRLAAKALSREELSLAHTWLL
jgi:hypothetical protein